MIDNPDHKIKELLQEIEALRKRNQELEKSEECHREIIKSLQQHRMLMALLNLFPHQIFVKDTASRFIMANEATAQALGRDNPADLIGKTDFDFMKSDLAAWHFEKEQLIIKTGRSLLNEEMANLEAERWFLSNKVPFRDQDGKISGLLCINTNITALKKAIDHLKKSEETATAILNASPDIAVLVDNRGVCLMCNLNYCRRVKQEYQQLVGRDIFSYLEPETARLRKEMLDYALKTGRPVTFEDQMDNDIFIHSLYPIHEGEKHIKRVAIFSRCITQEREAQRMRKQADQRLRAFVQALPDLTVICDADGQMIELFAQAEHQSLVKYLWNSEGPGKSLSNKKTRQLILPQLHETVASGSPQQMEFPLEIEGNLRWYSSRTVLLAGDESEKPLIVWICRDITSEKNLEVELMHISEKVTRQIGRDLHDGLGQHLTALLWSTRLLADSLEKNQLPEAKSAQKVLEQLKQAIELARNLTHGLNPVELDEQGLLVALKNLVSQCDQLAGLRCEADLPPDLPELSPTISIALYRIAQEAITNAIKHADASLLKLSLNCREDALHLVVSDNGKGFDLHADESGMGLRTMSHRLRLINGELTVTSQPGNGTRIEARVPLRKL